MQIIHPLDAITFAVISAGGEIILKKPFVTSGKNIVNRIIFHQNGDTEHPVVPGRIVFLGRNANPELFPDNEVIVEDKDDLQAMRALAFESAEIPVWKFCKAGTSFPSDAIAIPLSNPEDKDPRLVKTAVWDSKYILVSGLQSLNEEN